MSRLILTILLIASCGKQKAKEPKQRSPEVAAKVSLYKSLHKGWAHQEGCDSLGFTALCKLGDGCVDADIKQAEGEPGRWYRNPSHTCYDSGKSASDISKDMFMMLWPFLYQSGQKQELKDIYNYGKEHGNVMGRGPLSRTFLTPSMVFLLQKLLGMIPVKSTATFAEITGKAGFEKHLDVMSLLTRSMINDSIDSVDYEMLRKYKDESPNNALFQALYHKFKDGNQQPAIDILLTEKWFPSDRLPTAKDRCEEYLWQRDYGSDWEPCDKDQTHDGTDLLITAWIAGQQGG